MASQTVADYLRLAVAALLKGDEDAVGVVRQGVKAKLQEFCPPEVIGGADEEG